MSPYSRARDHLCACFPRVSGDEPLIRWDAQEAVLFSPRERG